MDEAAAAQCIVNYFRALAHVRAQVHHSHLQNFEAPLHLYDAPPDSWYELLGPPPQPDDVEILHPNWALSHFVATKPLGRSTHVTATPIICNMLFLRGLQNLRCRHFLTTSTLKPFGWIRGCARFGAIRTARRIAGDSVSTTIVRRRRDCISSLLPNYLSGLFPNYPMRSRRPRSERPRLGTFGVVVRT